MVTAPLVAIEFVAAPLVAREPDRRPLWVELVALFVPSIELVARFNTELGLDRSVPRGEAVDGPWLLLVDGFVERVPGEDEGPVVG